MLEEPLQKFLDKHLQELLEESYSYMFFKPEEIPGKISRGILEEFMDEFLKKSQEFLLESQDDWMEELQEVLQLELFEKSEGMPR